MLFAKQSFGGARRQHVDVISVLFFNDDNSDDSTLTRYTALIPGQHVTARR